MNSLFMILFLVSFIALIVGLVNPRLVVKWGDEGKRGRKSVLKYYGLGMLASLILFSATAPETTSTDNSGSNLSETDSLDTEKDSSDEEDKEEEKEAPIQNAEKPESEEKEPEVEVVETTSETLSQKNAVRKAESYLDFSAFSESGLIKQLEYEGFSNEDATYAMSQISVDWKEQAVKKGESYLEFSAFSRSGLIDQLKYEGFSDEEANYAVDQIGL